MALTMTRSAGMLVLAITSSSSGWPLWRIWRFLSVTALLALLAGVLILIGR